MSDPATGPGQVANALSTPVTKLIEVVAAGCGRLYGPTGIRREARAHADALLIRAAAEAEAPLVAKRAAERLIANESRRQENIEAIVEIAQQQLPEKVSQEPVHPDWAARFFREAQDVSDEQMRGLWARLLAGEVSSPGAFSTRTITVVRDLAASEAALFNTLCMSCARIGGVWNLVASNTPSLTSGSYLALEAAGLISHAEGVAIRLPTPVVIETRSGQRITATSSQPSHTPHFMWSPPGWALTPAGRELCPLAIGDTEQPVVESFLGYLESCGFSIERHSPSTGASVTKI